MPEVEALQPVVVGTGLIGTSIGLALRRRGIVAYLSDVDAPHASRAASMGAGLLTAPPAHPDIVVIATPPDQLAAAIGDALRRWPAATVTDVGSIKGAPLRQAAAAGCDLTRYVGSHPIAGSERSGPAAAAAGLFDGRPWAVTPHDGSAPAAVEAVERLVAACGAVVVRVSPDEHDAAVARTSHLPYLLAVLAASAFGAASIERSLVGPGLRDTTRVAASDPDLWSQILLHNAPPVMAALDEVRSTIDELFNALAPAAREGTPGWRTGDNADAARALREILSRGVEGAAAIRDATPGLRS